MNKEVERFEAFLKSYGFKKLDHEVENNPVLIISKASNGNIYIEKLIENTKDLTKYTRQHFNFEYEVINDYSEMLDHLRVSNWSDIPECELAEIADARKTLGSGEPVVFIAVKETHAYRWYLPKSQAPCEVEAAAYSYALADCRPKTFEVITDSASIQKYSQESCLEK